MSQDNDPIPPSSTAAALAVCLLQTSQRALDITTSFTRQDIDLATAQRQIEQLIPDPESRQSWEALLGAYQSRRTNPSPTTTGDTGGRTSAPANNGSETTPPFPLHQPLSFDLDANTQPTLPLENFIQGDTPNTSTTTPDNSRKRSHQDSERTLAGVPMALSLASYGGEVAIPELRLQLNQAAARAAGDIPGCIQRIKNSRRHPQMHFLPYWHIHQHRYIPASCFGTIVMDPPNIERAITKPKGIPFELCPLREFQEWLFLLQEVRDCDKPQGRETGVEGSGHRVVIL